MSQHDMDVIDQSHTAFRADMNLALKALASLSSGASAPSTTFAYQLWADTTTGKLKIRDSTNSSWLTLGLLTPPATAFSAKDAATTTTDAEAATYATEVVDLGSNFNATTGRYTAPVAGTYLFTFTVQGNTAAGKGCTGYLKKNGAGTLYGTTAVASPTTTYSLATNPYSTGSVMLTLAAGDYVSAFVAVTGAAACGVTAFSGHLLEPA